MSAISVEYWEMSRKVFWMKSLLQHDQDSTFHRCRSTGLHSIPSASLSFINLVSLSYKRSSYLFTSAGLVVFLRTTWISWQPKRLNSVIPTISHKHVSIRIEAKRLWKIQLIGCRSTASRTTRHTSETIAVRSDYAMTILLSNEDISITIDDDSCWTVERYSSVWSSARHGGRIQFSRSKHLNSVIPGVGHIQIQANGNKDALRIVEHIRGGSCTTNASDYDRGVHCTVQGFSQYLMLIRLRTVEIAVDVGKETRTVCTDHHRWYKFCLVESPSVHLSDW